ncbi:MAG: hypothetical protein JO257_11585 [Deltaproteobacteria bacterium]|nr:hypothetical protein [Deltaproteobacteria bacterium]
MRWVRSLEPRGVLLLGFALAIVYAFPGYMSTDSVAQLIEARSGLFSDGHPPLMAAEWWVLDKIVPGPLPMLVLQLVVFEAGLYTLLRRALLPKPAAWTTIAILLFPPVLTPLGVIWKDSQMAAFLVAGTAALLSPRLRVRLGGLGLLMAACAVRHNGVAAVLPLIAILFEWKPGMRPLKRLGIVAATIAVTGAAAFGVTRILTTSHVKLTPVFSDVACTLAFSRDMTDAEALTHLHSSPLASPHDIQSHARRLCELQGAWRMTQGDDVFFTYPANDADWAALSTAWKDLVLGDPLAYLAYHCHDFGRILEVHDDDVRAPVYNIFLEDPHQMPGTLHDASYSGIQERIGNVLYWAADNTPLFRPYLYAAIAVLLLLLCCRDRVTFALLASGLLYELSFFPVPAEPDYRYSHWMITTTVISAVLLFIQRRRRG